MGLFGLLRYKADLAAAADLAKECVRARVKEVMEANEALAKDNKSLTDENVRLNQMLGQEAQARKAAEAERDRYREALEWFCSRVERGEVRSKRIYTRFKEILSGSKVAHEQEVPPNCIEIVRSYLMAHGFDGLYHEGDCGCELNDLCPCNNDFSDCTPGYKVPADDESDCDFYIVGENPAALQRGKEGEK